MIEFSDPYWRRLVTRVVAAALVVAVVAFAVFPTAESAHSGSGSKGAGGELAMSGLQWDYFEDQDHARVWVDVSNGAAGDATDLTATLEGIEPSNDAPHQSDAYPGNLARDGSTTFKFSVYAGTDAAISAIVSSFAPRARLALTVTAPSGADFPASSSGSGASLSLTADEIAAGGEGDWTADLSVSGALRGVSYSFTVDSTPSATSSSLSLDSLPAGSSHTFAWVVLASPPPQVLPANLSVTLTATVLDASGHGQAAGYRSTYDAKGESVAVPGAAGEGAEAFLTSGEFLGFAAIAIIGLSVASGALRTRGGRARSQERSRPEVSWHRFAWLAVLLVLLVHGLAQLIGGHLYLQAALLGTAATALIAGTIWLNAYQRPRVLAMEWPKWLRVKLLLVAGILLFIALHLALYGRHFAG